MVPQIQLPEMVERLQYDDVTVEIDGPVPIGQDLRQQKPEEAGLRQDRRGVRAGEHALVHCDPLHPQPPSGHLLDAFPGEARQSRVENAHLALTGLVGQSEACQRHREREFEAFVDCKRHVHGSSLLPAAVFLRRQDGPGS
jgi:hypothetical protein